MKADTDYRVTTKAALVLSGGGARGAYQVGVIRGLGELLHGQRSLPFPILVGASAGRHHGRPPRRACGPISPRRSPPCWTSGWACAPRTSFAPTRSPWRASPPRGRRTSALVAGSELVVGWARSSPGSAPPASGSGSASPSSTSWHRRPFRSSFRPSRWADFFRGRLRSPERTARVARERRRTPGAHQPDPGRAPRRGDAAPADPLLVLQPSTDLGELVAQALERLPYLLRHLFRGLGVRGKTGSDLLSYLAFDGEYT